VVDQEVGRWACEKCGQIVVAVGARQPKFKGTGAYLGACPWQCGAWMNRAFRLVQPGQVRVYRADEWPVASGVV
jgi:hypothetical protein